MDDDEPRKDKLPLEKLGLLLLLFIRERDANRWTSLADVAQGRVNDGVFDVDKDVSSSGSSVSIFFSYFFFFLLSSPSFLLRLEKGTQIFTIFQGPRLFSASLIVVRAIYEEQRSQRECSIFLHAKTNTSKTMSPREFASKSRRRRGVKIQKNYQSDTV